MPNDKLRFLNLRFEWEKYKIKKAQSTKQGKVLFNIFCSFFTLSLIYMISFPLIGTTVISLRVINDDGDERNQKFDLQIVSVTPKLNDLEFYSSKVGGCLNNEVRGFSAFYYPLLTPYIWIIWPNQIFDRWLFNYSTHQKAEKYTTIVEQKDGEQPLKLSSSCSIIINIEEGNDNLPVITQQIVSN